MGQSLLFYIVSFTGHFFYQVANVYKRSDLANRYFSHCMEALISEMKWNKCHKMLSPAENVEKQVRV